MFYRHFKPKGVVAPFLSLCLGLGLSALIQVGTASANPDLVVGPNECAECHKTESAIWQRTHHFTTFTELPRSDEARDIADKMGVKRLKAESLCTDCHFTMQTDGSKLKAIAGNSCESCHGPAKNWIKVHSNFSGKKEGQETPEEIQTRWEKAEAAGMIRPSKTYALAQNCFSCHLVPNEKLVNVGGHTAGSAFELVSWSQGEVRHNTWYNKGASNAEASVERRRMLFLVGRVAELEVALLGVSKATQKANYAVAMAKRANNAAKAIGALAKLLPEVPELAEIYKVGTSAKLKLNNEAELAEASGQVSVLGLKLADTYDGSTLGAVDKYLPGSDKYKGPVSNP